MKMLSMVLVLSIFLSMACNSPVNSEKVKQSTPIASTISPSVVPEKMTEIPANTEKVIGIKGELVKAFLVAHQDFQATSDIEADRKHIENYDFGFTETKLHYIIWYRPKREKTDLPMLGGNTKTAMAIDYHISKDTFKIVERKFYM